MKAVKEDQDRFDAWEEESRVRRGEHEESNLIQVLQRIARALEAIEKSLPIGPIQKQRHYY